MASSRRASYPGPEMRLLLARAGLADNGKRLTPEIIREVAETFSEVGSAPVVLGHELSEAMPALGWVTSLEASPDGSLLFGDLALLSPLKEAYELGYYRKWSVGLRRRPADGRWYLHHLAFLGAVPPAIKGLETVNLAEGAEEVETFEFAEKVRFVSRARTDWPVAEKGTPWDADSAKKRLVEKGGYELLARCCGAVERHEGEAELPEALSRYHFPFCDVIDGRVKVVPKAVSSGLAYLHGARGVKVREDLARVARPVLERLQKRIEKEVEMADIEALKKENAELKARIEELEKKLSEAKEEKAEFADLKGEMERLREAYEQTQRELRKERLSRLRETAEGKLPKEALEKLLAFADRLPEEPLEFSDGEKKVKRDPLEVLTEILALIPKPVSEGPLGFAETAEDNGPDPNELARKF